jgi:clan AA aspartic protease (TIGR02281 family)
MQPSAESFVGCHVHRQVSAIGPCRTCHQALCDVCAVRDSNYRMRCGPCARSASRRTAIALTFGGVVLVACATLGGLHYRRVAHDEAAAEARRLASEPPAFDYGIATQNIERLRKQLAKEPCDRRAILELADAAFRAGDHRGVLFHAEAFFKKCGDHPRLRWTTYEAHKQLSEWKPAAEDASKLIASDPHDADFRAWRGLVHEQTGDLEHAAEDYRQALMLRPQLRDLPINLANVYEKQGKACEGILPLAQLVFHAGNVPGVAAVRSRILSLEARPDCAWSVGEGEAKLNRPASENVFVAKVRINEREAGTFVVDTGATLVVLSRQIAARLQLNLDGAPLFLAETANGVSQCTGVVLDRVGVQGLHASHVAAAVSDGLGSIDGLLGMSFLTRFELWQNGNSLQLTTRKH